MSLQPDSNVTNPLESQTEPPNVELTDLKSTSSPASPAFGDSSPTHRTSSSRSQSHRKRLSVQDFTASQQIPDLNFSDKTHSNKIDINLVLELCAVKLKDAVSGRFRAYRLRSQAIQWYLMYHKTWYRLLLMLVTLVHLSCVLFEPPSSINLQSPKFNSPGGFTNVTFGRSHVTHKHKFFLGDYTHITMPFTTIVEALCIGLHWGDIFVQYKLSGGTCRAALDYSWFKIKLIVISLMTINSLVSIVLVFGVHEHPFNFIRMLRPLLLIEQLENVRKLLKSVINSFAKIRGVLSALFFIIGFFAVVATALFRGTTGIPPENIVMNKLFLTPETLKPNGCSFLSPSHPMGQDGVFCSSFSKNCLDYWKTIPHSWMHLFTVLTTANYPDVMMPVVECNEASFIFFAVFIFLGLFFFLNLVLAIVTNSFSGDTTRDMKSYQDKKLFMLADSFAKIVLCTEKNDNTSQNHYTGIINLGTGGNESESGTTPPQNAGEVEKEQEEKSKSVTKEHKEVDRHERLKQAKSKSQQNVLQLKSSAASSSRNSTVSNQSNHNYNDSKSSFAQMASGGSKKDGRNSLALPSSMENVGWGWSRVKVRRGQQDPFSLLDYNNINLSWKRTNIDEITKEEYVVYYEKGDIVITNGIEAELEAQRHVQQEFMKNRHRNKATEDNRDTAFGGKMNQPRTAKKHSSKKSISGKMETSSVLLPASSPSIRRIFVATCSNTDSHPMAMGSANKWKEIRMSSQSWCTFVSKHFSHIDINYALGHFNYLHDIKCPVNNDNEDDGGGGGYSTNGQRSGGGGGGGGSEVEGGLGGERTRGATGNGKPTPLEETRHSRSNRSFSRNEVGRVSNLMELKSFGCRDASHLDVGMHEDYNVAFEDFMISLVPILDARRVDLLMGYKCDCFSTYVHEKLSCMSKTRKKLLLWYHLPVVNGFFDVLVVFNTLLLITEIFFEDEWGSNRTLCNPYIISLCVIQVTILCVFVVELISKIYAFGLPRFWRSILNRIDLVAIVASFIFLCAYGPSCGLENHENSHNQLVVQGENLNQLKYCGEDYLVKYNWTSLNTTRLNTEFNMTKADILVQFLKEEASQGSGLQSFITLFRIIRIFRLFRVLRSVRVELRVVNKLVPLFIRFLGVLFFFFYIFGVIGMELFAGRMHYTIKAVEKSSYGLNRYYKNTFDDIFSTFMTLFELMVVNNWNIIMEGYVAATGSELSRLYFIVWFIVSVVVVMNVCAGFVIDAYSLLRPKMVMEVKYLSQILDERSSGNKKNLRSISSKLHSSSMANTNMEDNKNKCVQCGCVDRLYYLYKQMSLEQILSHIDTEYMVSTMPTISKDKKGGILFDQQLQNQLGIRVREHEHSYNQLSQVFDDDGGSESEDEEEEDY